MLQTVVDSTARKRIFCREGRKGEEQGLGLDKIEENPSAYCLMML